MDTNLKLGMSVAYTRYNYKIYGTIDSISEIKGYCLLKYLERGVIKTTITVMGEIRALTKEEQLEYSLLKLAGENSIVRI